MHPGILLQKYSKRFKFILQQRYNFSRALLKYRKYSNKRPGGHCNSEVLKMMFLRQNVGK